MSASSLHTNIIWSESWLPRSIYRSCRPAVLAKFVIDRLELVEQLLLHSSCYSLATLTADCLL